METNTKFVGAVTKLAPGADAEQVYALAKKLGVANPTVRTKLGVEYVQTETQRRWLSWQFVTRDAARTAFNGDKHSYAGTVPAKVIAERRAKNKRAKASRKANR